MLDALFQFLFKYRPVVFERGDLILRAPWAGTLVVLALLALAALWSYRRVPASANALDRAVLVGLRVAVLAVLALALLRPALAVSSLLPQQNFLAVLLDDSRSMQIADQDGKPRGDFIARSFGSETSSLRAALESRYRLRFFRFSSTTERTDDPAKLGYAGTGTDIAAALRRASQELAGVPLAGILVVGDGADNAAGPLNASLLSLRTAGVPVYTVGVGRSEMQHDIELSRATTPASVLVGASVSVDLLVAQHGYAGKRVPLQVEDGGRIIAEQTVMLPADGEPGPVRVRFTAADPGVRRIRFRIPPQPGEVVEQNNEQRALVRVSDAREKILYIEGEPRFEAKFIRRAVAQDSNLQVVVLQRTAPDKFLRLDVDRPDELVAGFPKTREELFTYKGLVLGSIEASFFTYDQLRMIADFVGVRGGGLLALGGRHSFAEGGYAGTPVADVLPVVLPGSGGGAAAPAGTAGSFTLMRVEPTRAGREHAATQLAASEDSSAALWSGLPEVSTVNPLREVKPGATTLLRGSGDGAADDQVVLAAQRFGRGQALALTAEDTWLWRMSADVAADDTRHETFWRQLLRWLVSDVQPPVHASLSADRVEAGRPVTIRADVADSMFLAVNDADATAHVRGPAGSESDVPLEWSVEEDGGYRARFVPPKDGVYEISVEADRGAKLLGQDVVQLIAAPAEAEYFDAGMHEPLLRRMAEETGGRFYAADEAGSLPDDLRYTGGGLTSTEEMELWDMPVVFLLLVGLLSAEWAWRRGRGLA